MQEGCPVTREDVETLSPYLTAHIKRFGDYIVNMESVPAPLDAEMALAL